MSGLANASPRQAWIIALLFATLAGTTLAFLFDDAFITNDAAQYIESARSILRGDGYATNLLYYDQHYVIGGLPATQTVWPPLFSVLIVAVSKTGVDPARAAFIVALAAYLLIPLLLMALLRRMHHGAAFALLCSSGWYAFALPWGNVLHRMSDMPFTLMTLLCAYCIARGEDSKTPRVWLFLAGTAASLSFTARYAGVFFVFTLIVFYGISLIRNLSRRRFQDLAVLFAVPTMVIGGIFARNMALTGSLTGGADPQYRSALWDVFDKQLILVNRVFGFSDDGFIGRESAEMLFLAFAIAIAVTITYKGINREVRWSQLYVPEWHVVARFSALYIALTIAILSYFALTKLSGYLHHRYLMALIPFAIVVLAEIRPYRLVSGNRKIGWNAIWTLGVAAFLVGQLNVVQQVWRSGTSQSTYLSLMSSLESPFQSGTVLDFLSRSDTPIFANESQILGFILDRPVLGVAPSTYSKRIWTVSSVREICIEYNVEYVIFFANRIDKSKPENANLAFFSALEHGESISWLDQIAELDSLRLYRVKIDNI